MTLFIYQWIDLLWVPVGWFVVHKQHRVKTVVFILTCILTMRTQIELIESAGFETGFLSILQSSLYARGLIVYSVVFALFLLLAHFSPKTQNIVFFAATLTIYIFAFGVSMLFMAL